MAPRPTQILRLTTNLPLGPCLTTYWTIGESNWSGSPISCPVCRAQVLKQQQGNFDSLIHTTDFQVTLILISFREANQLDSQRDSVIDLVRQYNRRFSGAPRPVSEVPLRSEAHPQSFYLCNFSFLSIFGMYQCYCLI